MLEAYIHASEVLTGTGIRKKGGRRVQADDMDRIADGAVVYSMKKIGGKPVPDRLEWVGPTGELPKRYSRVKKTDLKRIYSLAPGFVDCHTHLVFAGDRSDEFAARCAGATYEEIAQKGGGIVATVRATRNASERELEKLAIARLQEAYAYGVRTIEIKSGYGLSTESELKLLEVISKVKEKFPQLTIVPTFLGAHAFPSEMRRSEYLTELMDRMLPEVARRKLAQACDVFVDQGYFSVEEGRELLLRARELGMQVKVHADELVNTGSAELAAELGALSADHLLKISDAGVRVLAASETVAVLLPGTAFFLKAPYAPARKLLDAGALVALSTDFNPGTSTTLSLPSIMTLAALYMQMSAAEIFAGVTFNAAKALGLSERKGTIEPGRDADLAVLPFARFEEMYYRFSWATAPRAPR